MKPLDILQKERAELIAEAEVLVEMAAAENRELTKDEITRVDAILGSDDKPGLVAQKDAEIERAVKFKALVKSKTIDKAKDRNQFLEDEIQDNGSKRIVVPASAKRTVKHYSDPADAYAAGQFVAATLFGNAHSRQWCDDHGIKAVHTGGNNSKGGYLVPEVMEESIIRLVEDRGVFRQFGFVYPMSSDAVTVPRRSAGFTVYYVGEADAITASDLTLNQIKLQAKKPAILTALSSELSEDAVSSLASLITEELAYGFADAEDEAGFNGDGTSTYGGIVGLKNALLAGSVHDAATGNDAVNNLDLDDFNSCVAKMPMFRGIAPAWYMNSAVYFAACRRLMDAAGGTSLSDIAGGAPATFMGYPVRFVQVMPSTIGTQASTIVAYFGDLAMASTMGARRGVTIDSDSSFYFSSDQIAVRATERYDINVHERGSATEAGPIIALKTAS